MKWKLSVNLIYNLKIKLFLLCNYCRKALCFPSTDITFQKSVMIVSQIHEDSKQFIFEMGAGMM